MKGLRERKGKAAEQSDEADGAMARRSLSKRYAA